MFDGPLEALRESGDDARGAEVVRRQPRDGEELVAAVADEVRLPVGRVLEQVQVQGALAVRAEAALPDVRPLWPVRRRDAHATELVANQLGARRARLVAERLRVLVVRAVVPLHGPAGQVEVEPHDELARLPVIQHLWTLHHPAAKAWLFGRPVWLRARLRVPDLLLRQHAAVVPPRTGQRARRVASHRLDESPHKGALLLLPEPVVPPVMLQHARAVRLDGRARLVEPSHVVQDVLPLR
mmetsp:Transcript_38554/g.123686  ORF Transcript_38554/g.123686 Transcript_38554/m.123686 type:complete len:240 (-) Transcript_38554:223-942(-)